jgi:hypothetical protein
MIEASDITLVVVSLGVTLPLSGFLLVLALCVLGTTPPSGPGYIGPYQYALILAPGVFAVSQEKALAISVAAHLCLLGSTTVIGLALLLREQLLHAGSPSGSRGKLEPSNQKVGWVAATSSLRFTHHGVLAYPPEDNQ